MKGKKGPFCIRMDRRPASDRLRRLGLRPRVIPRSLRRRSRRLRGDTRRNASSAEYRAAPCGPCGVRASRSGNPTASRRAHSSPCDVSHRASDEPRRCMSLSSALDPSSLASPSIRSVFFRSSCARRRSVSSLNLARVSPGAKRSRRRRAQCGVQIRRVTKCHVFVFRSEWRKWYNVNTISEEIMAEKLLKKKARKVAPKKAPIEESKDIVLVGTYKEKQLAWIKRHGIYNYPVKEGDEFDAKAFAAVKELWLYADVKGTRHAFEAEFVGKMTKAEFLAANPTYTKLGPSKSKAYYVFKTKPLEYGPRLENPIVVVRTADFGGRSQKVKKAIEQFKADGEFAPLEHYLPAELARVPASQLRVCEAAVQMTFGFISPIKTFDFCLPVVPERRPGRLTAISLFSGGGGLDIGFEQAGFDILLATDFNHECCETLRLNAGNTLSRSVIIEADITQLDISRIPVGVDMIIGGPPCQSFSASGRRAGGAAGRLDKRGNLFQSYCKVVEHVQPKAFLFENVRGILATNKGEDFRNIVDAFARLGYTISYRILDAEDYGVPQQRERMFIVGHKLKKEFLYPRPVYGPDSKDGRPYVSVSDAIQDLRLTNEDIEETRFEGGRYASLLPLVPPGGNYLHFTAKRGYPDPIFAYRSRFSDFLYKANPNAPVKTLIASPGKYTGPLHWDNRYFSVSEYKRIQGFPDDHVLFGDRIAKIRQIGNSVCPKVAYYMALAIRDQIFGVPSNIEYIDSDYVLSFDKRKGAKARKTRAIHKAVLENKIASGGTSFVVGDFDAHVTPTTCGEENNLHARVVDASHVSLDVKCDDASDVMAAVKVIILNEVSGQDEIAVDITLRGRGEHGVQTLWNALDTWVKRSSHFRSLVELYGHFTEPHPIFKVRSFVNFSKLPIFRFAKYYSSFDNCSVYSPKTRLLSLWGDSFGKKDFAGLARLLRGYRYDIRCHETNIAIDDDQFMVAYPFSLPYDKQMNFCVKENVR